MVKIHVCGVCNYSTNRHSNLIKHYSSTKHKMMVESSSLKNDEGSLNFNDVSLKNDEQSSHRIICEYCKKMYSKSNISRHHKSCKYKNIHKNTKLQQEAESWKLEMMEMKKLLREKDNQVEKLQRLLEDHA